MAASSSSRGGTPITLVAVHTNEGPNPAIEAEDRRAENLARWMDGQPVSYHKIVDDDSVVPYVPDMLMSWSLRSGNRRSLNVCMIGRAAWDRDEWLRHDQMLRMTALIAKDWCERHGIPMRKLSPSQVGADQSGVIGHVDWTRGKGDGTHTDPGDQFPWDVFMRYVLGSALDQQPREDTDDVSIDNFQVSGEGLLPLICPVGKASGVTAAGWVSATIAEGTGTIRAYAQSDTAGVHDWTWNLESKNGLCKREYKALWDGVTQVMVHYDLTGRGVIGLETRPK